MLGDDLEAVERRTIDGLDHGAMHRLADSGAVVRRLSLQQ
jgi:hypothetical protein